MILTSLDIDPAELHERTGWAIKPEGACKGDVCVPLAAAAATPTRVDARVMSDRLGMPLIHDEAAGVWCLGPEVMGRALTTARAPHLALPDLAGNVFRLDSLRGRKIVLVAWASW